MVEPEPEIWIPVQTSCTNSTIFFLFFGPNCSGAGAKNLKMLEPEPKKLDSQSRSLKFDYRFHSLGLNALVLFKVHKEQAAVCQNLKGLFDRNTWERLAAPYLLQVKSVVKFLSFYIFQNR